MQPAKFARYAILALLLFLGVWLIARSTGLGAETVEREQAIQALAPVPVSADRDLPRPELQGLVKPVTVNLRDVPAGVRDTNSQYDRWLRGEIDLDENEGIRGEAQMESLRAAARGLAPSNSVQQATTDGPGLAAPSSGANWASMDYTECCGGGGNVPPDPELAVGPNHVIAVVNVALEIYDKSGNSLVGPTTFASFMGSNPNCTGVFDPNANYDEEHDRYVLGIDADGTDYCIAVSQTGDPTGGWNIYSFPTASGRDFFDYPHAGIGDEAIYMGANIFGVSTFKQSQVWAFDKVAMYNGQAAASQTVILGNAHDTPQPLNLHGWAQNSWPTGPHYFFAETNYDGSTHTVFSWSDPFGANNFSTVGTVNLNAATGVTAGMPVNTPQLGGQTVQANDFRPQDFEYRDGFGWTSSTIACNPGGGTVNCVRWAKIDLSNATVADAGVYGSSGQYRTFADLAVDACGNMAIGYSKSSTSMYPAVFATGRLATDAAGSLQAETQVKAGEIAYTSFETSAPRRWGDYTEMTIDPAGTTFWYLGEYSKNTGTSNGRWGTYISSFTYNCNPGSNPTPTPPPATNTPPPATNTPPAPTATPSGGITLNVNAYKDKGTKTADLTWSGATTNVDIYYNGSIVLSNTANDGVENGLTFGKGGGNWAFQICETGTSVCSPVVSGSW